MTATLILSRALSVAVLCLQKFVRDLRWTDDTKSPPDRGAKVQALDDLEISHEIAKGCNAVVYRARIKGVCVCVCVCAGEPARYYPSVLSAPAGLFSPTDLVLYCL